MTGKSKKIIATAVIGTVFLTSIAFADTNVSYSQANSNTSTNQTVKTNKSLTRYKR